MKDTPTKMKNNIQEINNRVDEAENQINYLEHKETKITNQNNKKKKIIQRKEDSISSLWDNFKRSNICIKGVPEAEEKEQEIGNLFEKIMKENFLSFIIPFIISFLSFT